jgi:hypothetical protein
MPSALSHRKHDEGEADQDDLRLARRELKSGPRMPGITIV